MVPATSRHARTWSFDDSLVERMAPYAVAAVAIAVLGTAIATFRFVGGDGTAMGTTSDWAWSIVASTCAAILAFGVLHEVGARGAHFDSFAAGFGLIALAACAVYWSGVPVVLGIAAIFAGIEVLRTRTVGGERPRVAEAGIASGALASVLAFAFCVAA